MTSLDKFLQIVFHIMSDGTAEEALARIFRVFDISGDGIISERELKRIVKDMYKLIKEEAPEEVIWKEMALKMIFICRPPRVSSQRMLLQRWTKMKMGR